jgi:transposase
VHQLRKLQRRQRRFVRNQQVIELYSQGHSAVAISRSLRIERKTVRRWLRAGQFPERKAPQGGARRPLRRNTVPSTLLIRQRVVGAGLESSAYI